MSAFSSEQNIDPTVGVAPVSLPREAILDTVPRSSLAATKKIINVVPITSNSIGPSQTIQFLLPQRNFAKSNSVYLKFRFKATGGSSSQQDWSFSGGMQSAGSLFNNISIQAGGAVLESMQNYHVWHNNVVEWMHDGSAMQRIESMCSGARIPENDYPCGGAVPITLVGTPAASTTLTAAQYLNPSRTAIVPGMILIGSGELGARTVTAVALDGALTFSGSSITWTAAQQFILVLPALYAAQQVNGFQINAADTTTSTTNFEWSQSVGQANSLFQFGGSASANQAIDMVFTIPIFCGFFNPKESQLIPLEFINGGVLLTLQSNPVTKAFYTALNATSANSFTSYTLQDFELCYTEIAPSPDYMMMVRSDLQMRPPKFIKIETQSYQNFLVAAANGSVRQMFNANLSSLSSILFGRIINADDWTTTKMFQWVGHDGNNTMRYEIYFDNQLIFQSANQLNDISVVVRQLQEALGSSIVDYNCTNAVSGRGVPPIIKSSTSLNYNANSYCGGHALMGLSTRVFSSSSTSMDGTPVGTITVNFYNDDGDAATNLWYFYLVYDYIYTVDASGAVEKAQ
jgi:hypothetical protein